MPVYPILAFSTISSQLSTQNYYDFCKDTNTTRYSKISLMSSLKYCPKAFLIRRREFTGINKIALKVSLDIFIL